MKSLSYYLSGILFLFSLQSNAQYAGGSMNMWGTGLNMGQQACPYAYSGGSRGGSGVGKLGNKLATLEAKLERLEEKKERLEEKIDDLISLNGRWERLPFKEGFASKFGDAIDKKCPAVTGEEIPDVDNAKCLEGQDAANPTQTWRDGKCYARNPTGPEDEILRQYVCSGQKIQVGMACQSPVIYGEMPKGMNSSLTQRMCNDWAKNYSDVNQDLNKIYADIAKAEQNFAEAEYKYEEKMEKLEEKGYLLPEGSYCAGCIIGNPEPEISGVDKAIAVGTDIFSALAWYKGTQYVSRNNARLGWATPPLALGMPYPYATANLYGAAYGGGQGSMGCSGTIGQNGAYGPNGIAGSPYGAFSPYGNAGGAFGFPNNGGYPGFTPGFAGGIFTPGIGPGGMPGQWGGNNGFFPGALGVNGALGYGNGYNGGAFPGAYPGGYGANFGLNGSPYGSSLTGYPGGFPGYGNGYNGGYPYGGAGAGGFMNPPFGAGGQGGWPYAGGNGGWPYAGGGINGGIGFGGCMDPYSCGGGRAYQNQSIIGSQIAALDAEAYVYINGYQYKRSMLMMYLSGGTSYGVSGPGYGSGGGYVNPPFGGTGAGTGTGR